MCTAHKTCEHCGAPFERPRDYSQRQWDERRFCCRTCAAQVIHETDGEARFFENFIPEPMSGCWLWLGNIECYGYGTMKVNGTLMRAHRFSYELHKGPIPDGLSALHHCDNRACVNPDHLYAGTEEDNARDMVSRDRHTYGERSPNAKLTERRVVEIRQSALTDTDLADLYGVSRQAVRNVRIGKTWRHVR